MILKAGWRVNEGWVAFECFWRVGGVLVKAAALNLSRNPEAGTRGPLNPEPDPVDCMNNPYTHEGGGAPRGPAAPPARLNIRTTTLQKWVAVRGGLVCTAHRLLYLSTPCL